jgi:hypothetical protein
MVALQCGCAQGTVAKTTPLLATVRAIGGDLPVRRSELIRRCGLKPLESQRSPIGRRGGWAGVREEWRLPDGCRLVGYFRTYCQNAVIIPDIPRADGTYAQNLLLPQPEPAPTTWFNSLMLFDKDGKKLADYTKLPAVNQFVP